MPTYEYACTECGERLEVVQSFSDDALTVCPACQGKLRKLFSPVGVVFKGSGFYKTDSRESAKSGSSRGSSASNGSSSSNGTTESGSSSGSGSDTSAGSSSTSAGSASSDNGSGSTAPSTKTPTGGGSKVA
jgi:putative FmdB family regulatory protein